jgi:uncharacterized membrane protein YozB (DUF420 family)
MNLLYNSAMLIAVSTCVLVLIALGLKFRKQPKRHIQFMAAAFLLDLILLLYIETTRHAIATVGKSIQAPASQELLFFHVTVSTITLLLYILQLSTGIMLFRKRAVNPVLHRGGAVLFLICRLSNYVTSFFVGQT